MILKLFQGINPQECIMKSEEHQRGKEKKRGRGFLEEAAKVSPGTTSPKGLGLQMQLEHEDWRKGI